MNKSKSLFWVVGVIILLVIIWVAVKSAPKKAGAPATTGQGASTTPTQLNPVMVVPLNQLPKGLPTSLPLEKNAPVLQNFTTTDPASGKTQISHVYVSQKTIDQDTAAYQKFLQDNGWTITSSLNQPLIKNFNATKGAARITITIAKGTDSKVTVSLSYVD